MRVVNWIALRLCRRCVFDLRCLYNMLRNLVHKTDWKRQNFDDYVFTGKKKQLVLFKLHGSTNWAKKDGLVVKFPFGVYSEPEGGFENVLIYPATYEPPRSRLDAQVE